MWFYNQLLASSSSSKSSSIIRIFIWVVKEINLENTRYIRQIFACSEILANTLTVISKTKLPLAVQASYLEDSVTIGRVNPLILQKISIVIYDKNFSANFSIIN